MLTGFSKLLVGILEFLEEPSILDGDNRLIGERLQQCDIAIGKWTNLDARDGARIARSLEGGL